MFAPPCSGPHSAHTPAAAEANIPAWLDATMRTVEVEQFCSWSAWRMKTTSSARTNSGSGSHGMFGMQNIRYRKFAVYDRS